MTFEKVVEYVKTNFNNLEIDNIYDDFLVRFYLNRNSNQPFLFEIDISKGYQDEFFISLEIYLDNGGYVVTRELRNVTETLLNQYITDYINMTNKLNTVISSSEGL